MSRIRKLSEGSELPFHRLKQRLNNARLNPASNMKIAKLSSSPYSKPNKIARTPSYGFIQPTRVHSLKKSNSSASVRSRKDGKNSISQEESVSLSQNVITPWENLKEQARILKRKLEKLEKANGDHDNHDKYIELFIEIIEKDVVFSPLLKQIKLFYDDIIVKLNSEIARLLNSIEAQTAEKQSYVKMLERISKENLDLGKELQKLESVCLDLQKALDDIQNVTLDGLPTNESEWKALIFENNQYSSLVQNMKIDIKEYQFKEDQLIRLVEAIKNKGFPVDEVYETEVKPKSDYLSDSSKSLTSSCLHKIPSLELSKVLHSSDSSQP
jgi:hypothetical protein